MRRLLFISFAVLLLCTGILLFLGKPILMVHIKEHVQARAFKRGIDVNWRALHWHLSGVSLTEVSLKHHRGMVRAPLLELDLEWLDWAEGRPHISKMVIHKPVAILEAKRSAGQVIRAESRATLTHRPAVGGLDTIQVLGGKVEIKGTQGSFFGMENILGNIYFAPHGLRVHTSGVFSTPWTEKTEGIVSTKWDFAKPKASIVVRPPIGGKSLVRGRFHDLEVEVDEAQFLIDKRSPSQSELTLHRLAVWSSRFESKIDQVVVQKSDIDVQINLKRPRFMMQASPEKFMKPTRSRGSMERAFFHRVKVPAVLQRFLDEGVVVHWSDGYFEGPRLPRLMAGHGTLENGHLDMAWIFGGGRTALRADWTPTLGQITYLDLTLDKVQLAPILMERFRRIVPERVRAGVLDGLLSLDVTLLTTADPANRKGADNYVAAGQLVVEAVRIQAAGVADESLTGIDLRVRTEAAYMGGVDGLNMDTALGFGPVQFRINTRTTDVTTAPTLRLRAGGLPVSCQDALDTLPRESLGPYQQVSASGRITPKVRLTWPFHEPKKIRLHFSGLISDCHIDSLNADDTAAKSVVVKGHRNKSWPDVQWLKQPFIFTVTEGAAQKAPIRVGPGTKDYVKLSDLPGHVGAAAYLSEEIFFPKNRAIDPGLIARALRLNMSRGRFVYGGSTVTQQLVKNLFLSRKKTLSRKLQEVLISKRITQEVSRDRVLELYLNCIEFGPNVYGIEHAARYYFQKKAMELTPRESVFLAMLKPAPRRGRWYRRRGATPSNSYWLERTEEIMNRLVDYGHLSRAEVDADRPFALRWDKGRYLRHGMSSTAGK